MSHTSEAIVLQVNPLFYDALSGKFKPECDPDQREHTLGRLMVAAVQKGTSNTIDFNEKRAAIFTYTPSWARVIGAEVAASVYQIEGQHYSAHSLLLRAPLLSKGLIISNTNHEYGANIRIESPLHTGTLALSLGDDLELVRDEVSSGAKLFFDATAGALKIHERRQALADMKTDLSL